ncbi:excisionase family DNA binding protein [Hydrogenivirga caldilitoris]|uniref:Excisionase family DNA binding protein n=1 Tax=Hydrogenivirga caldilitoris TaxID=246264 RepID=A0A497XV75_9AQUI|nr:helix-turn-helix domain-containing protein [Hydrogenivirga caldilitoris]RLJ70713.1 excisionase family DNA binding protein [Hydrogenivirga caldilitoris]
MSGVLTVKDVAQMLGVTEQQVRRLTYKGKLPGRKWGKKIIFLKEELDEYFRSLPFVNPMVDKLK